MGAGDANCGLRVPPSREGFAGTVCLPLTRIPVDSAPFERGLPRENVKQFEIFNNNVSLLLTEPQADFFFDRVVTWWVPYFISWNLES